MCSVDELEGLEKGAGEGVEKVLNRIGTIT